MRDCTPSATFAQLKLVWERAHSPVPRSAATRFSPDVAALAFGADHGSIGFATPRLLKFREIREWANDPILRYRMRIALHHQPLCFGPDFVAPELSPGDKELLLGRE